MKAFVLGAGLGTRLQPLTEWLPKPMVPVFHRPLIAYAFDHLRASFPQLDGFVVNTHHFPEAYASAFPEECHAGLPIAFRHEPVLLETAGGIANVADLLGGERFIVYNGDILTDMPLESLMEGHERSGHEVTLLLRSRGPGLHIGLDDATGGVRDIRGMLGFPVEQRYQFTGVYVVEPAFLDRLTPGKKESVIPIFLEMIRQGGLLGGVVEDRGQWWDLGDAATYLAVHREIPQTPGFPAYGPQPASWKHVVSTAQVDSTASIASEVVIGPSAEVGAGAVVEDAVLWPGARVGAGAHVTGEVIRGDRATHYAHFFDDVEGEGRP